MDLSSVASIAQHIANNVATIGANLDHCTVPGRVENSDVRINEIEIGMGIHNEPGYKRISPVPPYPELISELLSQLLSTSDEDRSFITRQAGDKVVLLVNNLGGISNLEINVLTNETIQQL